MNCNDVAGRLAGSPSVAAAPVITSTLGSCSAARMFGDDLRLRHAGRGDDLDRVVATGRAEHASPRSPA